MHNYQATIQWHRNQQKFTDLKYSRSHSWHFDGGLSIAASSSAHIVPLPYSVAENIDPEEAYIAALSSCHMLFFLSIAAKQGYVIDYYSDSATGLLQQTEEKTMAITQVILAPKVVVAESQIMPVQKQMPIHEQAHKQCFIANSVKTTITINPIQDQQ